ncbi:hypothetical protein CERSUDRAFT_115676 [Gelatoporia subvermispora B]|uniref:AAA+ ATPase domain-containing protein n=1 Tax=Ceriporiopsis subvermispora (strain B) TaxID=914234 RepID=M2PHY6_CERS8|nr:hypothetical protein CERSUDRAFT_115676 [Gelatoporia subvermispora B]
MRWAYSKLAFATVIVAGLAKYYYRAPSFVSTIEPQFDSSSSHPTLKFLLSLKRLYPQSQHATVVEYSYRPRFPVLEFLNATGVPYTVLGAETNVIHEYREELRDVTAVPITKVAAFTYQGVEFRMFEVAPADLATHLFDYVFDGTDDTAGRQLLVAAHDWAYQPQGGIWVFEDDEWTKSAALLQAVQNADWDEIVLEESFRESLRRDTQMFFASRERYKSLGVSWKRGLLLLGPPGNGKTESIKALLHEFSNYPALYVTSMAYDFAVRTVFEHARKNAPCILVLEDLDSMVTDHVRTIFLNELDGLAENDGILTIATTNHPERIDDAILNRPSRFDVKYDFSLPSRELGAKFAMSWIGKVHALDTDLTFQEPDLLIAETIARETDGWSFAFLKELSVSFLLRIAHDKSLQKDLSKSAHGILLDQMSRLASQVSRAFEDSH